MALRNSEQSNGETIVAMPKGQSERVQDIPHKGWDSSLAFLREGYEFISKSCDRLGSDAFTTRIMLTPVVCMRGAEAAKMFYGKGRFTRVGAMPRATLFLLQDKGSVQLLDGEAHRRRKTMFMAMMAPQALQTMGPIFAEEFRRATQTWSRRDSVVLHDAFGEILTRAATRWAGVPLPEDEVGQRTRELTAMIENAGSMGPTNWLARHLRRRAERWAAGIIEGVRNGDITAPAGSALEIIAVHNDDGETPLPLENAVVELLNVLRPIVAVARFMTFSALALHYNPGWRERFASGEETDLDCFVQEVRRIFPFFPAIGGRVVEPFSWLGHAFARGDWVLLDIYGTNRDPRLWPQPETFDPTRFRDWIGNPYTLIPQGGGAFETGHRCPGEWLTINLMREAVQMLSRTRYDVPEQDLTINLRQMPALPASGFVIANPSAVV